MRNGSNPDWICQAPEGCDTGKPHKGLGLCTTHYRKYKAYQDPHGSPCVYDDCPNMATSRGWCNTHYERWRRNGFTETLYIPEEERFWSYVDRDGPVPIHDESLGQCWGWTGSHSIGYAMFYCNKVKTQAHRYSYALLVGPIGDGMFIDHICWNKGCVNPDHLEQVTPRENTIRAYARFQECLDLFVTARDEAVRWQAKYEQLAEQTGRA